MRLNAGQLNQLIEIQSPPTARDAHGQLTGSHTTFATVWASVQGKNGSDFIQSEGEASSVMYEIKIRYLSGVLPKMRIVHDSKTYEITAAFDPDSREERLIIHARQVQ